MPNKKRYTTNRTSALVLFVFLPHISPFAALSLTIYESKAVDCLHNAHQDMPNKAAITSPAKPAGSSIIALDGNNMATSCM